MSKNEIINQPPEILWHYTSLEAAIQILNTQTMRATHYAFLNDRDEIKKGWEILEQEVNLMLESNSDSIDDMEKCRITGELIKSIEGKDFDLFIISFSEVEDSLSQWMGYTPDGGCAIGFRSNQIVFCFSKPRSDTSILVPEGLSVYPCIYDREIFKEMAREMIQPFAEKWGIPNRKKAFSDNVGLPKFAQLKNQEFHIEKEHRLLFRNREYREIQFNGTKPYVKIEMRNLSDLISEIQISPHCDQAYAEQCLKYLIRKLAHEHRFDEDAIKITKSKQSYIGKRK